MIIWRYSRKKGAFMKISACIPALATVLLITAGTAQAQEASGPPVDPDADTLTVVVGGAYLPSYEGSDDYIASPGALVRGARKSVVSGKSVSVRVDLGGRGSIKKKKK